MGADRYADALRRLIEDARELADAMENSYQGVYSVDDSAPVVQWTRKLRGAVEVAERTIR